MVQNLELLRLALPFFCSVPGVTRGVLHKRRNPRSHRWVEHPFHIRVDNRKPALPLVVDCRAITCMVWTQGVGLNLQVAAPLLEESFSERHPLMESRGKLRRQCMTVL